MSEIILDSNIYQITCVRVSEIILDSNIYQITCVIILKYLVYGSKSE